MDEDLATIEEEQKVLDDDYEKVQRTSEGVMTGDQSLKVAETFEGVLMRQDLNKRRYQSMKEHIPKNCY